LYFLILKFLKWGSCLREVKRGEKKNVSTFKFEKTRAGNEKSSSEMRANFGVILFTRERLPVSTLGY